VEARITAPVEVELLGIPNLEMLRSVAKYALTDITIDFAEGTDIYWARQQVAERLNGVWEDLPTDISGGVAPMTTPLGEMFMFTVEGGGLSLTEHRDLLDWVIRPALRTVPGVADVNALGGLVRTYEVVPDKARMIARGISLEMLQQALRSNNRNDGAGRLNDGEEVLLVRTEGAIRTLEDVAAIVVRPDPVEPVRVADVADVRIGSLTRYGAVTHDGTGEVVEGLVLGLRGANAREVVAGLRAKLEELRTTLPEGVEVKVFYDRGKLVERAVGTVTKALGEAIVLVLVLLLLFLGNWRAALTVALVLPLAAMVTFIMMYLFGLHIIYRAVREVATPMTSGILIIIIVFLPLLTLQGLEGKLFTPVALTIVFALSGSLLLSLSVIPVLSSYLLGRVSHQEPWLVRRLEAIYLPVLRWSLEHSRIVVGMALTAMLVAAGLYTLIGKTFMPVMDEGDMIVQLEKIPRFQRALMERVPEVLGVVSRTGSDELGLDPMGLNETDSFLILKPREQWTVPDKEARDADRSAWRPGHQGVR